MLKERIKKIRKELDLTQQKLADKLGVKRNTIAMYEMGKTTPSDQTLKSISREFNVNEEWLRTGTGEMFKASPTEVLDALAEEYGLTHGDYVLIEKFVNLKAEKRAAVVDYVLQAAAAMQGEGTNPNLPATFSAGTMAKENLLQKPIAEMTDAEVQALKKEIAREIDEEKEAKERSSDSSTAIGKSSEGKEVG